MLRYGVEGDDIIIQSMIIELGREVYPISNHYEVNLKDFSVGASLRIDRLGLLKVDTIYCVPCFNVIGEQVFEVSIVCSRG